MVYGAFFKSIYTLQLATLCKYKCLDQSFKTNSTIREIIYNCVGDESSSPSLQYGYDSDSTQIKITHLLACCRYCSRFYRTFFEIRTTISDKIHTLAEIKHFTKILNNQYFAVPIYVSIENKWTKHLQKSDREAVRKTQLFQISEKGVTGTDLLLDLVTGGLNRSETIYHNRLERHWDPNWMDEEIMAFYQRFTYDFAQANKIIFDRVRTLSPNIITHSPYGYSLVTETKRYTIRNLTLDTWRKSELYFN